MSTLPAFGLVRPTSLDEAVAELGPDRIPYAGGTELLLAMRAGFIRPDHLVDLKRVESLRSIQLEDSALVIGGAVTHAKAASHPEVVGRLPLLAGVLRRVGNPRVRASGTLGGNLCFAEPKSDVATALIALDADVELRGASVRRMPVASFVTDAYTTERAEDELLTAIRVPLVPERGGVYLKYQTMERPTVGVALTFSEESGCRLVVGAVGLAPQVFEASHPSAIDVAAVVAALEVVPDLTGSEEYKRHVAAVYVRRAVENWEARE